MVQELTHFIGGKHVKGTSGRFSDAYEPMTGEVRSRVPLASRDELRAAVENAKAAQPAWAATNPQRRARVLMKFLELVAREYDSLAETLAREHGKTIPDAKGDIQRGLEVVEFCIGAPQMMKGEYTEGAGPGIDIYSMRQPLGVVAGITPFNFPAMIPLWKCAPAIAAGNAFILKPSERDPSVPLRIAELFLEAGLPAGILNVVNGDKEAVDAILDDPDIKAVGFVGSTPIAEYVYARGCASGKRVQCFGGAKNHMIVMPDADMDQAVDALIAPDIFHGECANVLARLVRIRKMTEAGARGVLLGIRSMVKSTVATDPLVGRAFDLALQLNHGVFDCLYLEVARSEGARLVTADARFVAKLRGTSDASLIVHLADWTP